jgi:hypothetical protein
MTTSINVDNKMIFNFFFQSDVVAMKELRGKLFLGKMFSKKENFVPFLA